MVAATVLMPTHDHGETLRYSIPTALRQTVDDLELLIIGDGVPHITREIGRDFAASDRRVRFFDFPKGMSRGEEYRHRVLQEASGEIVCYLFDDDLWLPDHIEVMRGILRDADLALTMPVVVQPDGELSATFVDLKRPLHRSLFTNGRSATPSVPTCVAHTMALYRRLPSGWRATPRGLAPDKYMWEQCLREPPTVARSTARPTAVVFPDPPRRNWTMARRLEELERWSRRLEDPTWQRQFLRDAAAAAERRRFPEAILRLYSWSLRMPPAGQRMLMRGAKPFFRAAARAFSRKPPAGE